MSFNKVVVVLALIVTVCFSGCTNPPAKSSVSELPEPAIAKEEAKSALRQWQALLETGQNLEFVKASMPQEVYEVTIDDNGELKPAVVDRLRAFAPKIVNALNEAQFVEPYIAEENVVFEYDEIHNSNGFFKGEKIYLTKSNGRWLFNGQMIKEVAR